LRRFAVARSGSRPDGLDRRAERIAK
jgi:hypothetical protein